jgi:hypothetical protein
VHQQVPRSTAVMNYQQMPHSGTITNCIIKCFAQLVTNYQMSSHKLHQMLRATAVTNYQQMPLSTKSRTVHQQVPRSNAVTNFQQMPHSAAITNCIKCFAQLQSRTINKFLTQLSHELCIDRCLALLQSLTLHLISRHLSAVIFGICNSYVIWRQHSFEMWRHVSW